MDEKKNIDLLKILGAYNPWWEKPKAAFGDLPKFRRPIFDEIIQDVDAIPQIISITGPRRVGKSTIIRQVIKELINRDISEKQLIYYSMDDPTLFRADIDRDLFFETLMDYSRKTAGNERVYIFLDEIQRFERWELFLKKYYDLNYPVRFIVSGSASSPIFKKTRESLLGRVKDYHLLPFSFREFALFKEQDKPSLISELQKIHHIGEEIEGMLTGHLDYIDQEKVSFTGISEDLQRLLDHYIKIYFVEGGFPEVWSLTEWDKKIDYLFDNQVEKVISEDLVLAAEFRKPELLKRFYVSLLALPGQEVNFQKLASDIGINRSNIEKYFPLLEMTDLIRHVQRFSKNPVRVRRGNIKCYLVDLALRNAVLRIGEEVLKDDYILGLYAENLVFNALKKWRGAVETEYYKDRKAEVDFIIHAGAGSYLPIEVKYREHVDERDHVNINRFRTRFHAIGNGVIVTKRWRHFGRTKDGLIYFPLPYFLILFD